MTNAESVGNSNPESSQKHSPDKQHSHHLNRHLNFIGPALAETHKARENALNTYFEKVGFDKEISRAIHVLMHDKNELPRNPFYVLVDHFKQVEVERSPAYRAIYRPLNTETNALEDYSQDVPITCVQGSPMFWGSPHVIKYIDLDSLHELTRMFKTTWGMPPDSTKNNTEGGGGYEVSSFMTLLGPAVFTGRINYTAQSHWEFAHHFVITGKKFEKAITIFAHSIMKRVFDAKALSKKAVRGRTAASSSANVLVAGVYITAPKKKGNRNSGVAAAKLWTASAMMESRSTFVTAIKTAIVAKQPIYTQTLHRVESEGKAGLDSLSYFHYVTVHTTYVLHHRVDTKQAFRSFTSDASQSLREGLFFSEDSAKLYAGVVVAPHTNTLAGPAVSKKKANDDDDDLKSYKSAVIKSSALGNHRDTLEKLYYLALMQASSTLITYSNLLPTLGRVLSHWSGSLIVLAAAADTIVTALEFCENHYLNSSLDAKSFASELQGVKFIVCDQFQQLRYGLTRIINKELSSSLNGRLDSHLLVLLESVNEELHSKMEYFEPVSGPVLQLRSIIKTLREISTSLRCLDLSISRDLAKEAASVDQQSVPEEQNSKKKIVQLDNFQNTAFVINQLVQLEKDRVLEEEAKKKGAKKKKDTSVDNAIITYDIEPKDPIGKVVNVNREVRKAQARFSYPECILPEAVRLQYVVDCRVDTAIQDAIRKVLTEGRLHQNPYTEIVSNIFIRGVRHDFFKQSNAKVLQRSMVRKNEVMETGGTDPDFIYYTTVVVEEEETKNTLRAIYGCLVSLRNVKATFVASIYDAFQSFLGCEYGAAGAAYSFSVSCAITGLTVAQSIISDRDDLDIVDIVVNFIIEGPLQSRAVELFSDAVLYDVLTMLNSPDILVRNISFGDDARDWDVNSARTLYAPTIRNQQEFLLQELQRNTRNSELIAVRAIAVRDGEYVRISKFYQLTFVELPLKGRQSFQSSALSWQHEAVFFSEQDAANALWSHGESRDPMESELLEDYDITLKEVAKKHNNAGDFLELYKTLLQLDACKSSSEDDVMADMLRMFSSPVPILFHVERSLDILHYVLDLYLAAEDAYNVVNFNIVQDQFQQIFSDAQELLDPRYSLHLKGVSRVIIRKLREVGSKLVAKLLTTTQVKILKECSLMVRYIRFSLASDLHQNCYAVQTAVKKLD